MSLVSKNYEIERTIVQLENEISQIKQQHGEANKENIQQDFWYLTQTTKHGKLPEVYAWLLSPIFMSRDMENPSSVLFFGL